MSLKFIWPIPNSQEKYYMKVLIVSDCQTHPTTAGNRRFLVNQVELFRKLKHDIHFLYVEEKAISKANRKNQDSIEEMISYFGKKIHIYTISKVEKIWFNVLEKIIRPYLNNGRMKVDDKYPVGLSEFVNKLNEKEHFDCLIVNYYYMSKLLDSSNIPLKGMTTHDYFCYKDKLVGIKNVFGCTDAHQEAIAMQRSPHIFALNTEEAILFSKLSPKSMVYNVFSTYNYKHVPKVGNHNILFLSGPNTFNLKGLKWFIDSVFPSIIKRNPDALLRIGGSICRMIPEYADRSNIELVGAVEDQDVFYDSADVVINPTYQGTGLKIKTFESISFDKVTLAHPHSLKGIYKPKDAPIFVSTNPDEWANYLYDVWNTDGFIETIKERNRMYLNQMQLFIESEYNRFFNSINYQ